MDDIPRQLAVSQKRVFGRHIGSDGGVAGLVEI